MNIHNNILLRIISLFALTLSSLFFAQAATDEGVITAIILINRQAELVDLNEDGEILARHMAMPDYFSPRKSHRRSLREGLRKLKELGNIDHTLPGSSDVSADILQSSMVVKDHGDETKEQPCYTATLSSYVTSNTREVLHHHVLLCSAYIESSSEREKKHYHRSLYWTIDPRQHFSSHQRSKSVRYSLKRYHRPLGRYRFV